MTKLVLWFAVIVVVGHGLIHLLGTVSYLRLGEIEGLPYKTAVLGGAWDVGAGGARVLGVLWLVAALAFLIAVALWFGSVAAWQPILLGAALGSLLLTGLDYDVAPVGLAVNVVIIATLLLAPRVGALAAG
jgi:hypothetical protein